MMFFVLLILAIFVHYVVGALVAAILWAWFVVPHGAPELGVAQMAGIMILVRVLYIPRIPSTHLSTEQLITQLVGLFSFYCFAFMIGWAINLIV